MKPDTRSCSVAECDRDYYAKNLCRVHYDRQRRKDGIITGERKFGSAQDAFSARTERVGECLIWTGARNGDGYGSLAVDGTVKRAHVYAWENVNGPVPVGMMIDHRFHCDTACVEVRHLRLATASQNNQNRAGATKRNASTGIRNVYPNRSGFRVAVQKNGTNYSFGTYATVEEATTVAEEARTQLFGEYAGRG